ncbi:hypothetical protein HC928_21855 [bacterium]|nr:hypothetical protein [bacterium]
MNVRSLNNKTDLVAQTIVDRSLDFLSLTETWHTTGDDVCLHLAAPQDYAVVDVARSTGRGGGVALIYRRHFRCYRIALPACQTLEAVCVRLTSNNEPIVVLTLYRPGSCRPSLQFFEELASLLEVLVLHSCPVVIGGDFNIHMEDPDDPDTRRLNDLLAGFSMTQHVQGSTHHNQGTLDLILTPEDCKISSVSVDPPDVISDHSLVTCRLPVSTDTPEATERLVRSWKKVDRASLRNLLLESELCSDVSVDLSVDQLFVMYDDTLSRIADQVAKQHSVRCRRGQIAPWFDSDCRSQRRECRRLERRYRRTRSAEDCRLWVIATRRRLASYRQKKEQFWLSQFDGNAGSSMYLWRSISRVLGRDRDITGITGHSAEGFAAFFDNKVEKVRMDTAGAHELPLLRTTQHSLGQFHTCSEEEVRRIIMKSPATTCRLDPVPSSIIREFLDLLLPFITRMVNASLSQGRLPQSQKRAIISPLIKKVGLDVNEMGNFRPVSNLTYTSKIVERAVSSQLHEYLQEHHLLPKNQSAYRRHHSTETAMLRVLSDALRAADIRQVTLLTLLDLSAAFDCVDHDLLFKRLEVSFGLSRDVLGWFRSFLSDRSQTVTYEGSQSRVRPVMYGVPQGSVLGPLLFVLYTAEIEDIIRRHGLHLHQYADDCQIYCTVPAADADIGVRRINACIAELDAWMAASRLRLNPSKTQVMWLGSRQQLDKVNIKDITLLSANIPVVDSARNLGVQFDSRLTMSAQVNSICRSSYYHLRQLRPVARSLSSFAKKTLIQAFIASRIDYCNALLHGIADSLLRKLQSVQNAAARLITSARRRDHMAPVLRDLHWLPVQQRIVFKVATMMYRLTIGQLPPYLADGCHLLADSDRRALRSTDSRTFAVPRTYTNLGDRCFEVAGPRIWNSLPFYLRDPDVCYTTFRRLLKSYLFP